MNIYSIDIIHLMWSANEGNIFMRVPLPFRIILQESTADPFIKDRPGALTSIRALPRA